MILARHLPRRSTYVQDALWEELRNRNLRGREFRRQHPIGSCIVDICCVERKWVVEVDGDSQTSRKQGTVRASRRLLDALTSLDRVGDRVIGVGRARIQQIMDDLCERANVEPRGYHALRHTCGTRMYRLTKDLRAVQKHLRHSSITMTQVYAHVVDEDYDAAVNALDEPLEG